MLLEGVFTLGLAVATVNEQQTASLTFFVIMIVFTYLYPIVPAPVIFPAFRNHPSGSHLLPRVFGYLAFVLGIAFAVVGLVRLFTTSILTIVVLSL